MQDVLRALIKLISTDKSSSNGGNKTLNYKALLIIGNTFISM